MTYSDPTHLDRTLTPLCRQYLHVLCESTDVPFKKEHDGSSNCKVLWAVGVLADGESELMGVWRQPDPCESAWRNFFCSLHSRGVEQIKLIFSASSYEFQSALDDRYPNTIVIGARSEASTLGALNAKHRDGLVAGYKLVENLQRIASRALIRQGRLVDVGGAVAVVTEVFRRAEQRRDEFPGKPAARQLAGGVRGRVPEPRRANSAQPF